MVHCEKLILDISTDGSIHPEEALKEAAKILIQHFIPFYKRRKEKYDEGVVIIEDGARYYYTALYKEVKDEHGVKCINHLAQSSDLNYIKNL